MFKTKQKLRVSFLVVFVTLAFSQMVHGQSLGVTVTTDKLSHDLGEDILVTGELTQNDLPVSDGLVAIQVNDPGNSLFAIRTRPTGTNPAGDWTVEILEVIPSDSGGYPKYSFPRGGAAGFKIKIRNNDFAAHDVVVALNTYYVDGTSFAAWVAWSLSIAGNKTETLTFWPLNIPDDAPLGEATVYASALVKLPKEGGFAYCPEKSEAFTITASTITAASAAQTTYSASEEGSFDVTFRVWDHGGKLGTYTVYVCSYYDLSIVTNSTTFEAILLGDIAGSPDGIVNIFDVATAAAAFGSSPGHPRWNPDADVVEPWDVVNIFDVARVAVNFGNYGVL